MPEAQNHIILNDTFPIINIPGYGLAILVSTTKSIQYAEGMSLATALAAHQAQIVDSAAQVARNTVEVADIQSWLVEHLGYVKPDHVTGGTYLTPLFAELPKAPTGPGDKEAEDE